RTSGSTEARTALRCFAPVALAASNGPGLASSMVSENSLDMMASENMVSAKKPGKGPTPSAATKRTAQNRSGMVRITFMKPLASRYTGLFGAVSDEAMKASGRARAQPTTEEMAAIRRVSTSGLARRGAPNSQDGGHHHWPVSPMTHPQSRGQ